MDDPANESWARYVLGVCVSVFAADALASSLAVLVCMVLGIGLTVDSFFTALFILGLLMTAVGLSTGVTGGNARSLGNATYAEIKVVPKNRFLVFSNLTLVIAGLIAILASIVFPLTL